MNSKLIQYFRHPLIFGSSIVFIGSFLSSILSYLFNLAMGRLLPVEDYGLLTALSSLIVLFGVLQSSLIGIFAKFAAKYKALNDEEGFIGLFNHGIKFVLILGSIVLCLLIVFSPVFSSLLKVTDIRFLLLIYLSIFVSILSAFPYGILQGEMLFSTSTVLAILNPLTKIISGLLFVLLGFKLFGALTAIALSSLIPLIVSVWYIRRRHGTASKQNHHKDNSDFLKEFKQYSLYFFLATFTISIISNADIMLVRYFFDPVVSGQYAALSLMGKAIFYLTSPIYFVFFPLIAQKKEKNEGYQQTLLFTIGIIAAISAAMSFGYFLFPGLVLRVFFPAREYAVLAPYLGPFSLYIFVFSLANLYNNFFLSMGKTGVYKINTFFAALFIILIVSFHSSLYQIIGILFITSLLLLMTYLVYHLRLNNG